MKLITSMVMLLMFSCAHKKEKFDPDKFLAETQPVKGLTPEEKAELEHLEKIEANNKALNTDMKDFFDLQERAKKEDEALNKRGFISASDAIFKMMGSCEGKMRPKIVGVSLGSSFGPNFSDEIKVINFYDKHFLVRSLGFVCKFY